ncbi:uncharacterized protein LOC114365550 [Ostrinia furnacalis]|uniref:uncharacterized protein LOC114365550 n=1 Tax=Ostrinia furnacalis TaxID=93504 RepID=UPI00103C3CC1|nr:uncharacterized protein LOC114365550 [Ostrinia furnacalis]
MTMELIAISESLKYIIQNHDNIGNNVVILSDSKSALQHLARCASGHSRGMPIAYTVLETIHRLTLSPAMILRLQWVPSHLGLRGNEEADRLAKLACTEGLEFPILPFYTEVLTKFKNICGNKFAFMMKKVNSPNCNICDKVEDVQHILVECVKFKKERDLILRKFHINAYDVGGFLNILANPTSKAARFVVDMVSQD